MHYRIWIAAIAFAMFGWGLLGADTIVLKDGRRLEATIVSEQPDHYVAMVQVTETIRDQRTISKADIREILTTKKDERGFEGVAELVPTPDRLEVSDYDRRIQRVEEFIEAFPNSGLLTRARNILETLTEERRAVAAGGIKFDGRMIPASQRRASAYTLDSRMAAAAVAEAAEANRRIAALRAWESFEDRFAASRAYAETLPLILTVMRQQLAAVQRSLETLDERTAERLRNLERVPAKDRARVEAEIERQSEAYQKQVAAEEKAGIRWVRLDPFEKDSLTQAERLLETEIRRLESLDLSARPDADQVWQDAWATLSSDPEPADARAALQAARQAGIGEAYLKQLEELAGGA